MDTSRAYITMCAMAGEIQALHDLEHGDYYEISGKIEILYRPNAAPRNIVGTVWLPRQDQLQAMAFSGREASIASILRFAAWCQEKLAEGAGRPSVIVSLEQLWLSFLMDERFGKCWNGQGWSVGVAL